MKKNPKPAMAKFTPETSEAIGKYVYALIDPDKPDSDPKRIFYVGQGRGQRCFSHARAEVKRKRNDEPNPKLKRIRKIRKTTGAPPPIQIIAHKVDHGEADRLEAALICVLQTDKHYCGLV